MSKIFSFSYFFLHIKLHFPFFLLFLSFSSIGWRLRWWSTCYLRFFICLLDHMIYLKLRKKKCLLAKLSKLTRHKMTIIFTQNGPRLSFWTKIVLILWISSALLPVISYSARDKSCDPTAKSQKTRGHGDHLALLVGLGWFAGGHDGKNVLECLQSTNLVTWSQSLKFPPWIWCWPINQYRN